MLNYNQALPEQTLLQDLQMKEIKPIMKLVIRGKKREFISAIGKSLNIILPTEANTSTQSDKLTALWLSPDEWMIFSNEPVDENTNTYETEKLLNKSISKLNLGAVVDVTDQFVMINLKGNKIWINKSTDKIYTLIFFVLYIVKILFFDDIENIFLRYLIIFKCTFLLRKIIVDVIIIYGNIPIDGKNIAVNK